MPPSLGCFGGDWKRCIFLPHHTQRGLILRPSICYEIACRTLIPILSPSPIFLTVRKSEKRPHTRRMSETGNRQLERKMRGDGQSLRLWFREEA